MYRGTFKDIDNNEYTVEIIPKGTEGHVDEIILSSNPVTISRKSDNLFTEIKPLSCTIEIVTDKILADLYSSNLKDVEVNVYLQSIKIFSGYLTPYIYNQPYANTLDTIQLECVSKMSVLKEIDYNPINGIDNKEIVSFKDIVWRIFTLGAGYDPNKLKLAYHLGVERSLSDFKISEANFFDDDEAKTAWKMDEVLTHICRYLGVSCVEYEDDWIYFLDYQHVSNSTNFYYNYYGMLNQTPSTIVRQKCAVCNYTVDAYEILQECPICHNKKTMQKVEPSLGEASISNNGQDLIATISKDAHVSNDAMISYDDIYNKLEVEANAYQIDELCTDINDNKNSHYIFGTYGGGGGAVQRYSMYLGDTKTHEVYATTKIVNNNLGWKHYCYSMETGEDITDSSLLNNFEYIYGSVLAPKYDEYNYQAYRINTRCAVFRQVANEKVSERKPTKMSFENYIAFYCLDNKTAPHESDRSGEASDDFKWRVKNGNITDSSGNIRTPVEQPVLVYTSDIPVKWCPETGTSWITIKGDLWYQQNIGNGDGYGSLYVVRTDKKLYAEFPYDGIVDRPAYVPWVSTSVSPDGAFYREPNNGTTMWMATRPNTHADYGKGFPMLKCSLQIGDYYWDADYQGWTTQPSTFYINYNNNPSGDTEETFACLQWQTIAPNHDYEDKIGDNCWAIPIKKAVDGNKVTGKLKFTLYTPSQLGPLYDRWSHGTNWQVLFPVIYMKGFELNYVYTDDSNWWTITEQKDDDLVYSNIIPFGGYNREHDPVEFKINSYSDTVPISRSFVLDLNNEFMTDVTNYDTNGTYIMEKHYIEKLFNHYQSKKLIYEASIKYNDWYSHDYTRLDPRIKHYLNFESISTFKNGTDDKVFLVDSFEINLKENAAKVKYIEW